MAFRARASRKAFALVILAILLLVVLSDIALAKATPTPTPKSDTQLCTVTGRVVDGSGNGVGGAKVALYNMTVVNSRPVDTGLTTVDSNPQWTSSGDNVGYFRFTGVPAGRYDLYVDVNSMRYQRTVEVSKGTWTAEFVVSTSDITPQTSATPTPTSSYDPIVTVIPAGPVPEHKAGNDDPLILRAGVGVLICLQFLATCVVLGLYMIRRI